MTKSAVATKVKSKSSASPSPSRDVAPAAEWMSPSKLKPWKDNPRKNDGEPVERVAASIKRFGFGAPIVARKANLEIIAGHTRWKAAKKLGLERVPVRLLDIGEKEAHTLALADNRFTELTEWDATLGVLLAGFESADAAFMGWSSGEIEKLTRRLGGQDDKLVDEVPEPPARPVTRVGDEWRLGRHRLLCADCRVAQTTPRFGAVLTDPPYGIAVVKKGMVGAADFGIARKGKFEPVIGDDQVTDQSWLLDRGDVVIVWGGNYFANALPRAGGWLVWDKRSDSGIQNTFADCELAWSNQTGPARVHRQLWIGMIREGEHDKRVHPTQKPVALMAWCLGFSEGDVFDPYAGSGSTLIAAEQLERTCMGIELSPAYCDVIVERWQNLTGKKATRSAT